MPVPQRDTVSLVLWVSTVCCAWELLSGLYKRAVLSLSADVSERKITPTAFLYAQAGLSKVLHCSRAGIPTALGKSSTAPSSCVLSQARGSCAQQHVPTHCLNDVALFWTVTILSNTMTEGKQFHTLAASNTNTVLEVSWQLLMSISFYRQKALAKWNALLRVTKLSSTGSSIL